MNYKTNKMELKHLSKPLAMYAGTRTAAALPLRSRRVTEPPAVPSFLPNPALSIAHVAKKTLAPSSKVEKTVAFSIYQVSEQYRP